MVGWNMGRPCFGPPVGLHDLKIIERDKYATIMNNQDHLEGHPGVTPVTQKTINGSVASSKNAPQNPGD